MEIKKYFPHTSSQFWCHFCQIYFQSDFKAGKDLILCPQCNNDFCQVKTRFNHPERFRPYQKQPHKKQKNTKKIDKHAIRMTVNELAQVLQIRQSQNFQLTQKMLQNLRKSVNQPSECSVCRIDLQIGQQAIIPKCSHSFHQQCLIEWIKRKNTCPTCRRKIVQEQTKDHF